MNAKDARDLIDQKINKELEELKKTFDRRYEEAKQKIYESIKNACYYKSYETQSENDYYDVLSKLREELIKDQFECSEPYCTSTYSKIEEKAWTIQVSWRPKELSKQEKVEKKGRLSFFGKD